MSKLEEGHTLDVGGLAGRMKLTETSRRSLAKFVELSRRQLGQSVEQLANNAGVKLAELLAVDRTMHAFQLSDSQQIIATHILLAIKKPFQSIMCDNNKYDPERNFPSQREFSFQSSKIMRKRCRPVPAVPGGDKTGLRHFQRQNQEKRNPD
jgi:hypothetical protein